MSNFIARFTRGQSTDYKGIPFGEELKSLSDHINGITKGKIYAVGGPEKSGKSTFTDFAFILKPYLFSLKEELDVSWIYYSFEIDRVSKEFDFAVFFLYNDYGIEYIKLPEGITKDGKDIIPLSPQYLKGEVMDDIGNKIPVSPALQQHIQEVYYKRIVPLFGEYNSNGIQTKKGLITFIENRATPLEIFKSIVNVATQEGTLHRNSDGIPISYTPNNSNSMRIVIIDHIRKITIPQGKTLKQTMDEMSDYLVILKNLLHYAFVPILHTNRDMADIRRLTYMKGDIYPTSDQLKDSGNLGEDCDYLLTMLNPNDDKLALKEHFGLRIRTEKGNLINPYLRTIHLVASRHCDFPRHFKTNMHGNLKTFKTNE